MLADVIKPNVLPHETSGVWTIVVIVATVTIGWLGYKLARVVTAPDRRNAGPNDHATSIRPDNR